MSIIFNLEAITLAGLLILSAHYVRLTDKSGFHAQADHLAVGLLLPLSPCQAKQNAGEKQSDPQTESYVNVTLRLREGEKPEIVRTTQVDGKLVERQGPASAYLYEITKDGRSYYVGFLPQEAFELRGFSDPHSSRKEKRGNTTSTTVILSVPDTSLDALRSGHIGLRIYKLKQGVQLETISIDVLKRLVKQKAALIRSEVSGSTIARDVKPNPD